MYFIQDVVSYNKKTTYARRGDWVTVIADYSPVAIVEYNGNRFPTLFLNLSKQKKWN